MNRAGADAIRLTIGVLEQFPEASLEVERRETSIQIVPTLPESFPVTLYDEGDLAMIAAGRWHTHADDPKQAAFCVWWLLTPFYRVVHESKNGVLVAAWIERYESTGWCGFEPVYFLNPDHAESWIIAPGESFTRRYTQQAVAPPPGPYARFCPDAKLDPDGLPPGWRHGSWVVESDLALGPGLIETA